MVIYLLDDTSTEDEILSYTTTLKMIAENYAFDKEKSGFGAGREFIDDRGAGFKYPTFNDYTAKQ